MDEKLKKEYRDKGFYAPLWNRHYRAYLLQKPGFPLERVKIYSIDKLMDVDSCIEFFEKSHKEMQGEIEGLKFNYGISKDDI